MIVILIAILILTKTASPLQAVSHIALIVLHKETTTHLLPLQGFARLEKQRLTKEVLIAVGRVPLQKLRLLQKGKNKTLNNESDEDMTLMREDVRNASRVLQTVTTKMNYSENKDLPMDCSYKQRQSLHSPYRDKQGNGTIISLTIERKSTLFRDSG